MEVGDDEWEERARDYNRRQRLLRGSCECGALYPEEHTARREGVIEGLRLAVEAVATDDPKDAWAELSICAEIERRKAEG